MHGIELDANMKFPENFIFDCPGELLLTCQRDSFRSFTLLDLAIFEKSLRFSLT